MADCELHLSNGVDGYDCDEDACVFWRVVEHLDVDVPTDRSGCAIQHYGLLEGSEDVAAWLLSVKRRLEAESTASSE